MFKDFLANASDEEKEQAVLIAEFIMENPDNRVEYDFYFSSSDDRALDFIRDFEDYHLQFGDKVLFTPRYVSWSCQGCDDAFKRKHCISDGRYCALGYQQSKFDGNVILKEDLRQ